MNLISVAYQDSDSRTAARAFAAKHQLDCVSEEQVKTKLVLVFSSSAATTLLDKEKNISIHVDFLSGDLAHRQKYGGGRGQAIAKAIGLKPGRNPPSVIDATAGLGRDAFVLATLGCTLTLLEQSPVVAELVKDGIERASEDKNFQQILEHGFKLINQNSIAYLEKLQDYPEVIYLDPMFPERKKSASVKKNMQLLQKLLGHDEESTALLDIALKRASRRVVVKRPKGAPVLSGHKPTYQVESKKMRYDIYLTNTALQP